MEIKKATDGCFLKLTSGKTDLPRTGKAHAGQTAATEETEDVRCAPREHVAEVEGGRLRRGELVKRPRGRFLLLLKARS